MNITTKNIEPEKMKTPKPINYVDIIIILTGIALAIAIRYSLIDYKSFDFIKDTKGWYNTVKEQGFSAFGHKFSDYNPPYLYLLYLIARIFPDSSAVLATKLPSMIADFVSAWFAYRIVRLKYANASIAILAAFAILFAPTIIINSAFWGQFDALYTCSLLATLYFVFTKKYGPAMLMFGLSVSFKAQAVFLFPFLIALLINKMIPWKYYLLIPLVMMLVLIPAWIAGRPLLDLLLIYPSQTGSYKQLTMNAPSVFSLVPSSGRFYIYFYHAALITAVAAGIFFSILVSKSRIKLTPSILIELALITVLMIPFILPKMHERYFYSADVISIIFAFYFPRYLFVPIIMSLISIFSYLPTLFAIEPLPLSLLALGIFVLIVFLSRDAIIHLFPVSRGDRTPETQ
jgi:Gpi18-like mannosyltransferase